MSCKSHKSSVAFRHLIHAQIEFSASSEYKGSTYCIAMCPSEPQELMPLWKVDLSIKK